MEQIDVIQYEKDLKKQRLKRLMKNKQALSAAFIGVAQIPSIIFNDMTFFKVFGGAVIGLEFSLLRRYWKREKQCTKYRYFNVEHGCIIWFKESWYLQHG